MITEGWYVGVHAISYGLHRPALFIPSCTRDGVGPLLASNNSLIINNNYHLNLLLPHSSVHRHVGLHLKDQGNHDKIPLNGTQVN